MDDAAFASLIAKMPQSQAAAPAAPDLIGPNGEDISQGVDASGETAADLAPKTLPPEPDIDPNIRDKLYPAGGRYAKPDPKDEQGKNGLSDPSAPFIDAPISGAAKLGFQFKDFVAGETPERDKSNIRKALEQGPASEASRSGMGYSLAEGVSQFAIGMMGAAELTAAAKGTQLMGGAIKAVEAARGGEAAIVTAQVGGVGAAGFDPHQERLSNLIQSYPHLRNPVTDFLASKPDDSAAMGRLKNALESVGMEAVGGTLIAGLKLMRAAGARDIPGVAAAQQEAQMALQRHADLTVKSQGQGPDSFSVQMDADPTPSGPGSPIGPNGPDASGSTGEAPPAASDGSALPDLTVTPKEPPTGSAEAPTAGGDAGTDPASTAAPDAVQEVAAPEPIGGATPAPAEPTPPEVHVDGGGQEFTKAAPGEPWKATLPKPPEDAVAAKEVPEDPMARIDNPPGATPAAGAGEKVTNPRDGTVVQAKETRTLSDFLNTTQQPITKADAVDRNVAMPRIATTWDVAKRIVNKFAGDVKVHVVSKEDMNQLFKPGSGAVKSVKEAAGYYDPRQHMIVVRSDIMAHSEHGPALIIHEAMHAAVHAAVEKTPIAKKYLNDLVAETKAQLEAGGKSTDHYGLSNAHEFLSEAMSNKHFQNMLMELKPSAEMANRLLLKTKLGSIWDVFTARVKGLLKLKDTDLTMLDAAMRVPDFLERAGKLNERGHGNVPSTNPGEAHATDDRLASDGEPGDGAPHPDDETEGPKLEQTGGPTADGTPKRIPNMGVTDDEAHSIYLGIQSDIDALMQNFGSWDEAVANGHIFGKGGSIPYQQLVGGDSLSAFITRSAAVLKDKLDKAKGGAVYTDAMARRFVAERVKLYGEDGPALMGLLKAAGKNANAMTANMTTSYLVAQRAFQDAYVLSGKIRLGGLEEFGGSPAAAMEKLRQTLEVANTAWGAGQSMRSAFGRGMRRLHAEFRPDDAFVEAIKGLDDDRLVQMLNTTGGDPRLLRKAMQPSLLRRSMDGMQFFFVNNMLWGLRTHFVNFVGNGYQAIGRPMERILGSLGQSLVSTSAEAAGEALRVRQEALKSYYFMGSSLKESWDAAKQAWATGDSVLHPHGNEQMAGGTQSAGLPMDWGQYTAQVQFKPWTSVPNVLSNVVKVAMPKTFGLPTRILGMSDEFSQQVVYRSALQSRAYVEALSKGLQGADVTTYVKDMLYKGFDDAGRGIDATALQEAKTSAFQQDLMPNTLGKGIQNLTTNVPWLRYVAPFVKTPTNVLRTGVKMTPGLNLLQKEYRDMVSGARGPEAQAQAIGQMSTGALFMGVAAFLSHEGRITGGGPSDPKQRAAWLATGAQPYSFVTIDDKGDRHYINFGRYDPVGMPFGMVADVMDVMSAPEDSTLIQKSGSMMGAIAMSLAKSITSKTYLQGVDTSIQALTDPDKSMIKFLGQMSAGMVPGASALNFTNQVAVDPTMREARDYLDYIKRGIPGFSQTLRPARDAWGDTIHSHPGLWVDAKGLPEPDPQTGRVTVKQGATDSLVDSEMRRMAEKPGGGTTLGPPSPTFRGGVDLRDVTMVDGSNAYDKLQEYARKPGPRAMTVKDAVGKIMLSPAYARAPDGDPQTPGTKMWMVASMASKYRGAAERMMLGDANVREAAFKKLKDVKAAYAAQQAGPNPTAANARNSAIEGLQGALTNTLGRLMPSTPQQ